MMTTLLWIIERLLRTHADAIALDANVDRPVQDQLRAVEALQEIEPFSLSTPVPPERVDLDSLRHEGYPWNLLVQVGRELRSAHRSVDALAREILLPDDEFRWRLFHLAVFGVVLATLRATGGVATALAPLSGGSTGPSYTFEDVHGERWDLWFEAAGIWNHYDVESPYVEVAQAVPGASHPLSPDIILISPGNRALIVECKYSSRSSTIGRGIAQAMAYALELHSALRIGIEAWTVTPEAVIPAPGSTYTTAGRVGVAAPSHLKEIISSILEEES